MPGIGIIINPHSRSHRRDPSKADRLGFIVGDKGSCHTTQTLQDVEELAGEFKKRKIEILGISGGDGTIHKTLTSFVRIYGNDPLPKIALLRGGTMNNLANTLNIKGMPEKILSNVILKYHEDIPFEEKEIDLMRINSDYGFLFGTGLVSRFIEIYNRHSNGDPSPWFALKLLTRAMLSAIFLTKLSLHLCERFDAKITVDGKAAPFKNYMMLFAGTTDNLGLHFKPLYRAISVPGQFQLVAISTTPRRLLSSFPAAFFGRPSKSDDYYDVVGKHAVIEFANPQKYVVDGDIPEEAFRVEISVAQRLKVIVS
jgi:diacylglycerol kinase family enzyme